MLYQEFQRASIESLSRIDLRVLCLDQSSLSFSQGMHLTFDDCPVSLEKMIQILQLIETGVVRQILGNLALLLRQDTIIFLSIKQLMLVLFQIVCFILNKLG